ncbi:MAG: DUF2256 domain-containing protein, partial [Actinobacteria bacterium]|nr:DUF2256 domain-containing protein [Actinomycetota bacterium]
MTSTIGSNDGTRPTRATRSFTNFLVFSRRRWSRGCSRAKPSSKSSLDATIVPKPSGAGRRVTNRESKVCARCGREITWRAKWAKNWD